MKQFPIMVGYQGTAGPCPSSIPWDAIAPYEGHALENHQQSLERLAQRGGLDPIEAYMVMTGRRWKGETFTQEFEKEACAFLDKLVRDRDAVQAERDALLLKVEGLLKILSAVKENRAAADFEWTALDDQIKEVLAENPICDCGNPKCNKFYDHRK
jgi:hypothetical protein